MRCCFSLATFIIFSLFLTFFGLSSCESLCINFFVFFGVHWVYWMYMLMSFTKSGEILATIFSTSFYHFLEFLFTHMLVCLLVSHSSSKFCSEFILFSFSSSDWVICIDTSKFTNSIFCQLKSAVEPSLYLFTSVFVLFNSRIFICFLFIISIFFLIFSIW